MAMRPTQRTMDRMRSEGWAVGVVERWIQATKQRSDLFGFIDLIAIRPGRCVGVQCGAGTGHAKHRTKICVDCADAAWGWLQAGNEIQIWSWRQIAAYRKDGSRAKRDRWDARIEDITAEVLKRYERLRTVEKELLDA